MNSPTPFDVIFDALEARLGVPCPRSPHGDAATSSETRITWERNGAPKWEPIPFHRRGARVIGRYAHPWTATIYAPTDLAVCELLADLSAALDTVCGTPRGSCEIGEPGDEDYCPELPGYDIAPGKVEPVGDDEHAEQWACPVAVSLRQPVVAAKRGTAEGSARLEVKPATPDSLPEPTEVVWPS